MCAVRSERQAEVDSRAAMIALSADSSETAVRLTQTDVYRVMRRS